jgi:hypothetical protein
MSCRNTFIFVAVALVPACSGDGNAADDDDDSGGNARGDATASLPANCSGPYDCFFLEDGRPISEIQGKLVPTGGTCSFMSVDPSLTIDLSNPKVVIDGRRFSLRETSGDAYAFECDPLSPTAAASKHCTGNAESCSLDDCYRQAGCRYDIGFADNPSDDRCRGSADACSTFGDQEDCEHQLGCSWA